MGHWRSNIFVRPNRVRDHTMYHRDSGGGISYAEFRHLGKEGVLGKYSIHFHLVGDTMRGSGVLGASIWDHQSQAHPIAENCCARGRAHPSGTWGSYRCLTMPGPF